MRKNLRAVFFSLLIAAMSAHAETLIVGVESIDQYPIYKGENGQYTGFARELLDDFAAKYKHNFEYKPLPILRLHDDLLKTKTVDLKFPDNLEWKAELRKGIAVAYSKPVVVVTEGLSVLPANKGKGIAIQKTIGAMRGFTPWQYMEAINSKKISFTEVNNFDSLVKMAESGRIDGLFANSIVVNFFLTEQRKQPNLLVFDEALPHTKTNFNLSSVKHPQVIAQFDEYLVKERLAVEKLKLKYSITK